MDFLKYKLYIEITLFLIFIYIIYNNLKRFGIIGDSITEEKNKVIRENNKILSELYSFQLSPNSVLENKYGDVTGKFPTKTEINEYILMVNSGKDSFYEMFKKIPTQMHISVLANQHYKNRGVHLAEKFKNSFTTNERLQIFDLIKSKPLK